MAVSHVLGIELPATVYTSGGSFYEIQVRPTVQDFERMGVALDMAKIALELGDNPIGAVLATPFGDFPAYTSEYTDHDREAHAEKKAYRDALAHARGLEAEDPRFAKDRFGLHLTTSVLYSTAELCVGCSHLFDQAEVGTVFIAATRKDASEFFRDKPVNMKLIWENSPRTLMVVEGLRRAESVSLLNAKYKRH